MVWFNSGSLFLSIEHKTAENEADIWAISIENAFEGDTFDYIDAFKGHATLDSEDGTLGDVQTIYEDGTGLVTMDGDILTWTDNADGEPHVFGLTASSTTTKYTDADKGAAELTATSTEEDNSVMSCQIEWAVSDTDTRIWSLTMLWDDDQNVYVYSDAECTLMKTVGEEFSQETVYTGGAGIFTLMGDGSLVWTDNADGTGTGCRFVMNMIAN